MIVSDLNSLDCTALILAGGQATRFNGQDKGLLHYKGTTFIEHIANKFPSNWPVFALTHGNQNAYQALGISCINDSDESYQGPMIALQQASQQVKSEYLVAYAVDCPTIPLQAYAELLASAKHNGATFIATQTRDHYCCLAVRTEILRSLKERPRSMRHLLKLMQAQCVVTALAESCFKNINTQRDFETLKQP